jgi:hypothetical protein
MFTKAFFLGGRRGQKVFMRAKRQTKKNVLRGRRRGQV